MENMQEYEIAGLLAKALIGALSPEEEERLEIWRTENPELYRTILDAENKKKRDELIRKIEVENAWSVVKKRSGISLGGKTRFFYRWTTIAASVVFCLGIGTLLFFIGDSVQKQDFGEIAKIETGSSKAVLITSGGKQITLEDTTTRQIVLENGMVAVNDGKKVMYTNEVVQDTVPVKVEYNRIQVPRGGEYELYLSDHTKVILNSATELRFPVRFEGKKREVFLKGEAFFSVTKDEKHPFVVKVDDRISVEVLGTDFNIMAYPEEEEIETTLNRGKVRVSNTRIVVELKPDQQSVYHKKQENFTTRQVDAEKYSAWKDGKFIFENATLESIMTRLSRWYNIHVFYQNPEAKEYHFTGDLERYDHFDQTLRMLEKATDVRFQINKDNVIVSTVNIRHR